MHSEPAPASPLADRRRARSRRDGLAVPPCGSREALAQQARHPPADRVDARVLMMHPWLARVAVDQPGRGRRVGAGRRPCRSGEATRLTCRATRRAGWRRADAGQARRRRPGSRTVHVECIARGIGSAIAAADYLLGESDAAGKLRRRREPPRRSQPDGRCPEADAVRHAGPLRHHGPPRPGRDQIDKTDTERLHERDHGRHQPSGRPEARRADLPRHQEGKEQLRVRLPAR